MQITPAPLLRICHPPTHSHRPRNTQVPNLAQHLLDAAVQNSLRILLPGIGIQILLHLGHARVRLGAEAQLDLDEGLEAGVQVGHAEIDDLGQFGKQLVVEGFVGGFGHVGFLLGARELGDVLVGFFHQLFHFGARGVVVEEFVVALFDAFVYVGEVGAEARDGF